MLFFESLGRFVVAMKKLYIYLFFFFAFVFGQEYHISPRGKDSNPGTAQKPFKTISKATEIAQPGAVITVHEGVYREHVNPLRGGTSDTRRIVYQAAVGETVVIKGSEVVKDWERLKGNVWKVIIPNSLFGNYNPYKVEVGGDWYSDMGRVHHTGEVYLNEESLFEVALLQNVLDPKPLDFTDLKKESTYTWFCEADENNTYIYANFQGANPNKELVEINVRKACFYPEKTGINYITVRGFRMLQAATQWAPATAEQIGLIGTNWSKGWIIENNVISDSKCTGITLGKDQASGQNVWSKNLTIDGATHFNKLIDKALKAPYNWSKETIGSHIVRNNTIYNCEQAGICGSMGCAFSTVDNNHIYDIWVKRQFSGAAIAGIKFHGPIDGLIKNNRVHNARKGIWLDWMTQGTRVTGNLIYDIYLEDIFVEVNHGPFTIDNNLILGKGVAILDGSSGGAYIHNLVLGKIVIIQQERATPWHGPHTTRGFGRIITRNADNRYYNNIFSSVDPETVTAMPNHWWENRGSYGLGIYNGYSPMYVDGNVYYKDAKIFNDEDHSVHISNYDPKIRLEDKGEEVFLHFSFDTSIGELENKLISTTMLGRAKTPDMKFENADGSPFTIDRDYFDKQRNSQNPFPGPFESPGSGTMVIKVWPK